MRVLVSAAVSADGYMDDTNPGRLILSGEEDWREVYALRASCDAILVGAETIRRDDPALVIRDEALRRDRMEAGLSADIAKVAVSGSGRLDPSLRFFTEGPGAPKIVFVDTRAAEDAARRLGEAAEIVALPEITAHAIVENLAARGMKRLMVEGGARIIKMFIDEDAVDRFRLAVAPVEVADPAAPRLPYFGGLPFENRGMKTTRQVGRMRVTDYIIQHDQLR